MYEPEQKSNAYLIVVCIIASLLIWAVFIRYRPVVLEASCSEIASNSTDIVKGANSLDPDSSYENIKSRCLESAMKARD